MKVENKIDKYLTEMRKFTEFTEFNKLDYKLKRLIMAFEGKCNFNPNLQSGFNEILEQVYAAGREDGYDEGVSDEKRENYYRNDERER